MGGVPVTLLDVLALAWGCYGVTAVVLLTVRAASKGNPYW